MRPGIVNGVSVPPPSTWRSGRKRDRYRNPKPCSLPICAASIRLDMDSGRQVEPLCGVGSDEVGKLLGRIGCCGVVAGGLELCADIGAGESAEDRCIELGDDRLRRG